MRGDQYIYPTQQYATIIVEEPKVVVTEHEVLLRKPMGIILEAKEGNPSSGVV